MASIENKRIAKNTIALYIRNLVGLFIGLFTVRIVLKTLGESDYGIYSVVGGTLAFLTFISGALATGNQRFFSYVMGLGDTPELKRTFRVSFTIYFVLAIIIIALAESLGVWFINNHLTISPDRKLAANIIFQFSIISTGITLLASPFATAIMAHEDMHVYGHMAIVDAIVKILVCVLLVLSPFDKLITYSFMLMIGTFIVQGIYFIYAKRKYDECGIKLRWDKKKTKEITSFSFWNLFGSLGWVVKNQGISIILNIFFGPIINAAHGVAMTVRTVSGTFSNGFSSAVQPQIVKKYAQQDYKSLSGLLHRGSKMTYYLMLVVVVPIVFCIDFILQMWVGDHSNHMATFCQLLLIEALIDSISSPLASANQATGKIAMYQFLIGLCALLNLPLAFVMLKLGYAPEWVLGIGVILQVGVVIVRILFLKRIYPGALKGAIRHILLPCSIVTAIVFLSCWFFKVDVHTIWSCLWAIMIYIAICFVAVWIFGLAKNERQYLIEFVKTKFGRNK